MPIALFLKVDGADGESVNAKHVNWTDLKSFSWGANQPSTMHEGGGGGAGKVSFSDCTAVAHVDKAYPALLIKCASGEHISKVDVSCSKAGGEEMEYFKITLEDVLVTNVDVSGASGAEVLVTYSFQAAKVKSDYSVQTDKGSKGATSSFGWHIKKNIKL
ncbi:MAG: type VI secretion system tube protein Hcp [Pseudomonadota bacterium]|nr:type VI secretion system tube protein Hcp [Pseudomonadota bacterium]